MATPYAADSPTRTRHGGLDARRAAQEEHDDLLRQSVCYWRMTQPQVDDINEDDECMSSSDTESENEYEVLCPSDRKTKKILAHSEYYDKFMPHATPVAESLLAICGSFPVRMAPVVLSALVRRFTEVRFNWETKTLQSFLEVACWVSVTYVAYTIYHDVLWAFQLGTFVGALMSICDEVMLHFARGLARVIRNQPGGGDALQRLGFDVPKDGKAPTDGQEVLPIKNCVFGYLGIVTIRAIWAHFHDVKHFALVTAAVGVAFVVTGEFFCLWLPTRRIGLTLQSRWTQVAHNWRVHFVRSLIELLCWTLTTAYLYWTTQCFLHALQVGTLVAVAVCLSSGLKELPNRFTNDELASSDYMYWQEHAAGDIFLTISETLVKIQTTALRLGHALEHEAMAIQQHSRFAIDDEAIMKEGAHARVAAHLARSRESGADTERAVTDDAAQTTTRSKASAALARSVAHSWSGLLSSFLNALFATLLALSTYALNSLTKTEIDLGMVQESWSDAAGDCPVMTLLQGNVSLGAVTKSNATLTDLQGDECNFKNWTCAEKLRPNTERVLALLVPTFASISDFDVPELASAPSRVQMQYVSQLSGSNVPMVQYWLPGSEWAVVCSFLLVSYRPESEFLADIKPVAMCSKRQYDPDWICENDVALDVATFVTKVQAGKTAYYGKTTRGELYNNPGHMAKVTGSIKGIGDLQVIPSVEEFNDGVLVLRAIWDIAMAYKCKGTFNFDTYRGMRVQGQGKVSFTWSPDVLLVTNSVVLWSMVMYSALAQLLYLPRSHVCVVPVFMSKTFYGIIVLAFALYNNNKVQVLTTFLSLYEVSQFNTEPYRLSGPIMIASIVAIMSGTAVQLAFNPHLVTPSYILTIVSVANFIIVFVLEAYVFPFKSKVIEQPCALSTSTDCWYYSATKTNYYRSPLFALCIILCAILYLRILKQHMPRDLRSIPEPLFKRRASANPSGKVRVLSNGVLVLPVMERTHDAPIHNSVLRLFSTASVRVLATSTAGGCVHVLPDGQILVDAGVLLNKNFVRVCDNYALRSCNVKYAMLCRFLPRPLSYALSSMVGLTLALRVEGDELTNQFVFLALHEMKLHKTTQITGYYA
ncbi:TPA: hypothetical protein N0F65_011775 [Lagenidium giganteum]|uniref:Uncharacterized protein n=1 Tax=Lagenidium giganteum TaxID=4803 RepID=A0AAV2YHI3_9STRA|nr:TPA: hypothetical protein N0F65_011775 [Lagenidium giganteum]